MGPLVAALAGLANPDSIIKIATGIAGLGSGNAKREGAEDIAVVVKRSASRRKRNMAQLEVLKESVPNDDPYVAMMAMMLGEMLASQADDEQELIRAAADLHPKTVEASALINSEV